MLNNLKVFILTLLYASCSNQQVSDTRIYPYLDSLLNSDSILAIYSHGDAPPFITDDAIEEDNSPPPPLRIDSIYRWTNSKNRIDSIRSLFPRLKKFSGSIEMVCCGHRELLIETNKKRFRFSWNINTSDSAIIADTVPYKSDKMIFNKMFELLDRKIISREIVTSDTVNFSVSNSYNIEYRRKGPKTNYIHILK